MPLIKRLLEDHQTFRRHIAQSLATASALPDGSPPPTPTEEDRAFSVHLRRHARMEGELLFPALQRAGNEITRQKTVEHFIAHGQDEHASVAKRHAELNATAEGAPTGWRASLERFIEGLTRHMEFEEQDIFPLARELLSQHVLTDLDQKAEQIP